MAEGYDADYEPQFGNAEREVALKSGIFVRLSDVPLILKDGEMIGFYSYYRRFRKFGFHRANWGEVDNITVEAMEIFTDLQEIYFPERSIKL